MHAGTLRAEAARSLVGDEEFSHVVATVFGDNEGMEQRAAERIVEEALKFVATCAATNGQGMRPSRAVDKGWHALILHTHTYERLCSRLGRFVHHRLDKPASAGARTEALDRTQELMAQAGYEPDRTLWLQPSGSAECEGGPAPAVTTAAPRSRRPAPMRPS
jgi:hypothetical protein